MRDPIAEERARMREQPELEAFLHTLPDDDRLEARYMYDEGVTLADVKKTFASPSQAYPEPAETPPETQLSDESTD